MAEPEPRVGAALALTRLEIEEGGYQGDIDGDFIPQCLQTCTHTSLSLLLGMNSGKDSKMEGRGINRHYRANSLYQSKSKSDSNSGFKGNTFFAQSLLAFRECVLLK